MAEDEQVEKMGPKTAHRPDAIHGEGAFKRSSKLAEGNGDEAASLMKQATEIAESMGAPNGAATPIKPAYELSGEVLLELGRAEEAAEQFRVSLLRMPNRTLSLRGLARAAEKMGDAETARTSYEKVMKNLGRHPSLPSYQEAKSFVSDGG